MSTGEKTFSTAEKKTFGGSFEEKFTSCKMKLFGVLATFDEQQLTFWLRKKKHETGCIVILTETAFRRWCKGISREEIFLFIRKAVLYSSFEM